MGQPEPIRNEGSHSSTGTLPVIASPGDADQRPRSNKLWQHVKRVLLFLYAQWFLLGIGLVILLAHFFPNVARQDGVLKSQWSISYGLVALIFLISGLTIPLADFYKRAKAWNLHLTTQITSFFVFPAITFAIVSAVRASDPNFERFNQYALVGMMVMATMPTTVSSNVVMTSQAGGDPSATTIEVLFGNTVGTFLSPALLQMFFSSPTWAFGRPQASGNGSTTEIYRQVSMQLGCAVFAPLFVGEVIQYLLPNPVKWLRTHVPLAKISSLCLLAVIWKTFSTAFYENAFERLSWQSIVFILMVNIGLYIVLSIALFLVARYIPVPECHARRKKAQDIEKATDDAPGHAAKGYSPLLDVDLTISLLFCGAAKGVVVGAPVTSILYAGLPNPLDKAIIALPLVLFQGSQVVLGQCTVSLLRNWKNRQLARMKNDDDTHHFNRKDGRNVADVDDKCRTAA